MEEILINHMFNGDYLKGGNIGHEIINLFKCDNGNHYIYAMSGGDYSIKNHLNTIKKVLLVRNIDSHKAEILGICDVIEDIFSKGIDNPKEYIMIPSVEKLKNGYMNEYDESENIKDNYTLKRIKTYKANHNYQKKYIDDNNITYGGIKLYNIFADNITNNLGHSLYLTFKVDNFRMPIKKMYFCDKDFIVPKDDEALYYITNNKSRMCGAGVMTFENLDDEKIQELINSPFWRKEDTSKKVKLNDEMIKPKSILNVIKKQDNELIYSNWIAYYLANDKELLKNFVRDFLIIKDATLDNVIVKREHKNIDVYIETSSDIIVIENKIKASINGTKVKDNISIEEKEFSQLEKYYNYAKEKAKKESKRAHFYLFLPSYSYKDLTVLKKYKQFISFTVIRYGALYDFFKGQKTSLDYYKDFINALENQTRDYYNDLYIESLERFASMLRLKK